jgi:hypothetical protein
MNNIIRSFGDIEGNEEGIIVKGNKRRTPVLFVYDSVYKHIFLVSTFEPIIRRYDLDGNLLQRINLEGAIIDSVRFQAREALKQVSISGLSNDIIMGVPILQNPFIVEGNKLIISITGKNGIPFELYYDSKTIIDKKIIKCEIETEDKSVVPSALKDFNNIMLLYEGFYGRLFVKKN